MIFDTSTTAGTGIYTVVYSYKSGSTLTYEPDRFYYTRTYYPERLQRPAYFGPETDKNKYRAAAIPPRQPPPVSLELAAHPLRLGGYDTSVSTPAIRAIPRRHARQATCSRSRRKRRVWERV